METKWFKVVAIVLYAGLTILPSSQTYAARIADIRNTKHNFSSGITPNLAGGASRVVSATTEKQICVFCHTPHAAEAIQAPLWNRKLSSAVYDTYRSGSIDATTGPDVPLGQPSGISKLCLSCHDGTLAIGAVNVLNGAFTDRNPLTADIAMQGTGANGVMAEGEGRTTGFTRFIGTDLKNDHPISLTFNAALALKDGDMRNPLASQYVGVRKKGVKPLLPLEASPSNPAEGMVQCNTCHDPHIRDNNPLNNENIKFLRASRFQLSAPTATAFDPARDIICLACHDKAGWVGSAHANPLVGNEIYTPAAAAVRDIPNNTQVWQTACLACHDTHTVQGSRRLAREGTDGPLKSSAGGYMIRQGGNSAVENTCFACHGPDAGTLIGQGSPTFEVPNTQTDFITAGNTHMPITTSDQRYGNGVEVHNIGTGGTDQEILATGLGTNKLGADFLESKANLSNRHVECPDCHNPHRVIKNRLFNANPNTPDTGPTHTHDTTTPHTNLASGVLKGIWGVEPAYSSNDFNRQPVGNITFTVKRGDPPINGGTDVGQPYLTREYQLCLKCHSNYAFGATPPALQSSGGGTTPAMAMPGAPGMFLNYTNIANEYNSPLSHMGEVSTSDSGAVASGITPSSNHRSWHPVRQPTGRTAVIGGGGVRQADSRNWLPPFSIAVGTQTMYCTDCHGDATAAGTPIPTGGENGNPWGPHGSANKFILKGPWDAEINGGTGEGAPTHLCFRCHDYAQYGDPGNLNPQDSGYKLAGAGAGGGMGGGGMCMMGGGGGAAGGGGAGMGGGGAGMGGMGMGGAPAPAPAPAPAGGMGAGGGMMCMAGGAGMGNGMGGAMNNLHIFHANAVNNFRCNLCHIAIPHGWKNKVFLNNLNDVGPEGGLAGGTEVRTVGNPAPGYYNAPYYNRAALKVRQFGLSGQWDPTFCGSKGANGGNGIPGVQWMAGSNEACVNLP